MINRTDVHSDFHGVHWTPIVVGAFVGLGLGFLLNLFGIAIGLTAFTTNTEGAVSLAVGGLLGIIIGIFVSMFVAGYASGYLGRCYSGKRNLGFLYGFTTWTLALILSAFISVHLGSYISTYAKAISPAIYGASEDSKKFEAEESSTTEKVKHKVKSVATAENLTWGAFSLFGLFFIGAFASCLGAYSGMHCNCDDKHK
jgi:hypothetical protein